MATQPGYLSEDTICSIATELGGALSIIRVSGPQAFSSLNRLTRTLTSSQSEPRKLIRAVLYLENNHPIDDSLFVRFIQPHSYTGEDLVEYHTHGGSFISHQIINALLEQGLRQALPGEFSFRAVRNGKMTLFQAQAVVDLISASNEHAVAIALEKMSGLQNHWIADIATRLRKLAVLAEVGIDFSDQDIDEISLPRLKEQLIPLSSTLEHLCQSYHQGFRLQEGIRVTFIGLPNAGKSTFFNALLGEDRSIVSHLAGTTRDIVREKLTLQGKGKTITLRLEDTAGLRITDHPIEKMGIERTHQAALEADLILFIVDPFAPFSSTQEQWEILKGLSQKTIGIVTKIDLASSSQVQNFLSLMEPLGISQWVKTSAITGEGIQNAIQAITGLCEKWTQRNGGEVILTRVEHFRAVSLALQDLNRAKNSSALELFASDIQQSLSSLGPLIGDTLPDDILEKIFSNFCIGK